MSGSLNRNQVGLILVAIVGGIVVGQFLPHTPLHAVATHGQDNFAVATGEIDDGIEAIYFLDFLTGDLKAAVLNPQNGKFTAFYEYNVLKDLAGAGGVKGPKFLMVTGVADMRRTGGRIKLGRGVVYVTEVSSGKVCAYAIPWETGRGAQIKQINAPFVPLDTTQFRNIAVRPM